MNYYLSFCKSCICRTVMLRWSTNKVREQKWWHDLLLNLRGGLLITQNSHALPAITRSYPHKSTVQNWALKSSWRQAKSPSKQRFPADSIKQPPIKFWNKFKIASLCGSSWDPDRSGCVIINNIITSKNTSIIIKSSQIKSNQVKSSQIKSNQVKSSQVRRRIKQDADRRGCKEAENNQEESFDHITG